MKHRSTRSKSLKNFFPKAVSPPKLVKPYGVMLGRLVAVISTFFVVVHLFRIDTLVEIIDHVAPGASGWASMLVVMIVLAEIFSIPFALRMKLSFLAQIISGYLIVLAPLLWLLVTIWAASTGYSTGLLGEFVELPASNWMIVFNISWLVLGFATLWSLGYNRLKLTNLLSK